jgi:hypothetical protein
MDDWRMSKVPFFTVRHVTDEITSLGVRIVGITENAADPSAKCFLFQISLGGRTDQDRQLGLDTYAVSNEWGASAYGCIDAYSVKDDELVLNFTPQGAEMLGNPTHVLLNLALSSQGIDALRRGLSSVIGDPTS